MTQWHPIFWTDEPQPGVWVMRSPGDVESFGRIEIRRVSGVIRYKVTLYSDVIGWSNTLSHACERLYAAYKKQRDDVYKGPPNGRR
ncbi:hypothetical protein FGL91_18585 [Microbacterium sp. CBA3102]|uniref:hypothetical protein n=1 Tax=Microbacterium sp. CBA3102 TaxID=2603598 RepID=UPI0011BB7987|nr:hypothetical protein [Microbacterium sp. CBA3102]QEA30376.1 hypothetical protein FGL91_18585 [Microbacterium sp. CBA3102]